MIYFIISLLLSLGIGYLIHPYLYSDKDLRDISLLRIPIALIISFILTALNLDSPFYEVTEIIEVIAVVWSILFAFYILIGIFVRLNRYWQKK
jgi:hypothetical protein